MQQHLWIINHYAKVDSGRHYELAKELITVGWKVTVFACKESESGVKAASDDKSLLISRKNNYTFIEVPSISYTGNGFGRLKNMYLFFRNILKKKTHGLADKPDVIIGSSVHPLAGLAGYKLAKKFRVPFVFEVRDLWPQTLIAMGVVSGKNPISLALKRLEAKLYSKSALIVSLLPGAHEYISQFGIEPKKVVWISNGINLGTRYPPQKIDFETKTGHFKFMYLGAHGQANDLLNIAEAIKIVSEMDSTAQFIFVGDGPKKRETIDFFSKNNLLDKNVFFKERVKRSDVPLIAAEADAFILSVKDLPNLYAYGISPNKVFEYFACGRPTVAAVNAYNNPVAEESAGITCEPNSPEELADAMVKLKNMSASERFDMAMNGYTAAKTKYSYKQLAGKLDSCLKSICA